MHAQPGPCELLIAARSAGFTATDG